MFTIPLNVLVHHTKLNVVIWNFFRLLLRLNDHTIIISGSSNTPSRLANLSEAELLSMVPDDIAIAPKPPPVARNEEPPPPGV